MTILMKKAEKTEKWLDLVMTILVLLFMEEAEIGMVIMMMFYILKQQREKPCIKETGTQE